MNMITDTILVESKSARENQLAQVNEERATEVLNRIKALYFAFGKEINTTVIEQSVQYFCPIVLLKLPHWLKLECFMGEKG
ncbi:MAG: hypothetical protein AB4368_05515 [Xenococcaceae cyanobacterium]